MIAYFGFKASQLDLSELALKPRIRDKNTHETGHFLLYFLMKLQRAEKELMIYKWKWKSKWKKEIQSIFKRESASINNKTEIRNDHTRWEIYIHARSINKFDEEIHLRQSQTEIFIKLHIQQLFVFTYTCFRLHKTALRRDIATTMKERQLKSSRK